MEDLKNKNSRSFRAHETKLKYRYLDLISDLLKNVYFKFYELDCDLNNAFDVKCKFPFTFTHAFFHILLWLVKTLWSSEWKLMKRDWMINERWTNGERFVKALWAYSERTVH